MKTKERLDEALDLLEELRDEYAKNFLSSGVSKRVRCFLDSVREDRFAEFLIKETGIDPRYNVHLFKKWKDRHVCHENGMAMTLKSPYEIIYDLWKRLEGE